MRLVIGGLCVLLAPLAGAGYGVYYFTHANPRTATATASVVRIECHRGGNHSRSECTVFTFLADDRRVEAESNASRLRFKPNTELSLPTNGGRFKA